MSLRNKIFVSYSHKDINLFNEFKTMIHPAIQNGHVEIWDDLQISTGQQWREKIQDAIDSAKVAVLLVSANFLQSDFIMKHEFLPLLNAAKRDGITIFWIYLKPCLYTETELKHYQAAHKISKALSELEPSKRANQFREICNKLLEIVRETPNQDQALDNLTPAKSPATEQDVTLHCLLLVTEALSHADAAATGGGPFTVFRRQALLAEKFAAEAKRMLSQDRELFSPFWLQSLNQAVNHTIPQLIAWSRSRQPEPGGTATTFRDDAGYRDLKHEAYVLSQELLDLPNDQPAFAALRNSDQRWDILGFRDKQQFNEYLYPPVKNLVKEQDPMFRDLFQRLLENPEFTPTQLHREGYREDVVLDSLNALLREKWAEWTLIQMPGDDSEGRMTPVGKRLLKQLLDRNDPLS